MPKYALSQNNKHDFKHLNTFGYKMPRKTNNFY